MVPLFTELYWWSVGYSKSCEIRTPLGWAKSVDYSEVSSFQRAISTIHRFHCSSKSFFCLVSQMNC
jgi:hypothetical protein